MALTDKYKELVDLARSNNLLVSESGNVLKVEGTVPSADVKDKLWEIYKRIDPHFKSNDLVLNVKTAISDGGKVRVITQESRLNIRKGPERISLSWEKPKRELLSHLSVKRTTNGGWCVITTVKRVIATRNTLSRYSNDKDKNRRPSQIEVNFRETASFLTGFG